MSLAQANRTLVAADEVVKEEKYRYRINGNSSYLIGKK